MYERKAKQRKKRSKIPGAPPGTLTGAPDAVKPVIRVMAFGPEDYVETELTDLDALGGYLARWPVTWVNVDGLGDVETIGRLGEVFDLHRLALEDVLNVYHRPKFEEYGRHMFIVLRMLEQGLPVRTEQLSLFFGEGFVLTFQEHSGDCLDPVRKRIRERRGRVCAMGADYLAYCLVDAVIDGYYPTLDELSDYSETLESKVVETATSETVSEIHQFKRDLLTMRRAISPVREAVNTLLRDENGLVSKTTRLHFRDCYDHAVQILEMVETYRELIGGLLDVYLSSVSNRMNEVMKVLTIIATMFIPLSFLAGVYGMNFDPEVSPWNMPELRWYWGYPVFLLILAALLVVELVIFWRKGWLGTPAAKPPAPENESDRTGIGRRDAT